MSSSRRTPKSGKSERFRNTLQLKLKMNRYEAEISRLRRGLEGRGGGSVAGGPTSPPDLPRPGGVEGDRPGYPPSLPGLSLNGEAGRCRSLLMWFHHG